MNPLDYYLPGPERVERRTAPLASGALVLSLSLFWLPILGAIGGVCGAVYLIRVQPKYRDEMVCAIVGVIIGAINVIGYAVLGYCAIGDMRRF